MEKKTQADRVLEYMQKFGSITTMQAFADLGVTRLSARIYELKHYQNIEIISETMTRKNRYGEICNYAKYSLAK